MPCHQRRLVFGAGLVWPGVGCAVHHVAKQDSHGSGIEILLAAQRGLSSQTQRACMGVGQSKVQLIRAIKDSEPRANLYRSRVITYFPLCAPDLGHTQYLSELEQSFAHFLIWTTCCRTIVYARFRYY